MKLGTVLTHFKNSETEKTASAAPGPVATPLENRLKVALAEAAAAPPPVATEKVAALNSSPVVDLMKTASEMVSAEHESLVKEAQLYGAAVMDGMMARASQYNEAATKLAAANPILAVSPAGYVPGDTFEKFASENPDLVREAAELGYEKTLIQMDKLAEAAHAKGYSEAVNTVYKLAHQSFTSGFEDTLRLVEAARK